MRIAPDICIGPTYATKTHTLTAIFSVRGQNIANKPIMQRHRALASRNSTTLLAVARFSISCGGHTQGSAWEVVCSVVGSSRYLYLLVKVMLKSSNRSKKVVDATYATPAMARAR